MSKPARPARVHAAPTSPKPIPDPCDMGALLTAAFAAAGINGAEAARRTGIAPPHIYRALRDPNARPVTVRRILAACGCSLALQGPKPKQ
jgi:DNA-binding phage protein